MLTQFTDPNAHSSSIAYDDLGRLKSDTDAAGGSTTLTRTDADRSYTVSRTTALNRTTTYQIENQTTGTEHRVNKFPDGTQSELFIGTDGGRNTKLADGTVLNLLQGPDPRFGMLAPVPTSRTTTTGGITSTVTAARTAALSDRNNPLSLTSLTETVQVNGRTLKSVYDAATRTFTGTSAAGRTRTTTVNLQGRPVQTQIADLAPTSYSYDTHGRLKSMTRGSGADSRTMTLDYNAEGLLSTLTDPLGQVLS